MQNLLWCKNLKVIMDFVVAFYFHDLCYLGYGDL
jgi:hypothetical protein